MVIDGGHVGERDKKPSEISRGLRSHAALRRRGNSLEVPAARDRHETGALPVMDEMKREAERRGQVAYPADRGGNCGVGDAPEAGKCHTASHVLGGLHAT